MRAHTRDAACRGRRWNGHDARVIGCHGDAGLGRRPVGRYLTQGQAKAATDRQTVLVYMKGCLCRHSLIHIFIVALREEPDAILTQLMISGPWTPASEARENVPAGLVHRYLWIGALLKGPSTGKCLNPDFSGAAFECFGEIRRWASLRPSRRFDSKRQ